MIDIALAPKAIARFFDDIADKILVPGIDQALGLATLPCEIDFYSALKKYPKHFLKKKPGELEAAFDAWLVDHTDYLVYASGSLDKFQRHLPTLPSTHRYRTEWASHQKVVKAKGGPKTCSCAFCTVSARAGKVFNWTKFSRKDTHNRSMAADFVRAVGFVVCPYCSRNYISPISDSGGEVYRPDLDHFYAKSIYPYFALCPYNLVPSCAACNCRIKGDEDFLKNGYFHPYTDTVPDQLFSLDGSPIWTGSKFDATSVRIKVNTTVCAKTDKSAKFFELKSAYNVHAAEIANFVTSLRQFPDRLIEERAQQLGADPHALKAILYRSTVLDKSEFKDRPLGKLYRDLYQFGHK